VYSAKTVAQRAAALGVDMPLTAAVNAVLDGQETPRQAVERLMRRDARAEALTLTLSQRERGCLR
jgi:glycerol-3-phosphate dehydrogenase (NAD(P)+)